MSTNSNSSAIKTWQAAVAATEAALIARGYTPARAHKCALDRNKLLHPAAQAALRRNIAANRDYIVGGAA